MIKKIFGICEAIIMVLLGAAILWLSLSSNYALLMNVKFRWLTATGAAMMLVLGLVAVSDLQKRSGYNSILFGLLMLVAFLGKPYLPGAATMSLLEPPLQEGLWAQIDQTLFPRVELQTLCMAETEEIYRVGTSFTTIGVAKRLETLDTHESFALMTSVMYCCVADAFAVGLRVPYEDWQRIEDGQWIMVSGKLGQERIEIPLPNFRFGMAMLSTVHETYYLRPDKIMSYDRVDQLPLLTEKLGGQASRLFTKALLESGLWQELKEEGPFTILVPVDQAMENLCGVSLEELSTAELKKIVSSHIILGRFLSWDLMERETVDTLNGRRLHVELTNGKLRINQSRLLFKDSEARNGVIHYIYPAISPE